ncbi:MAG: radical SAM protein [Desulfarculaceae bacterium]|jgi:radical SAM superfamily enzyme YgiQ (UPF0313 family)
MNDTAIAEIADIDLRGARLALITPPLPRSHLYGEWDLSLVDSISPPLGILSLAGMVRSYGGEVTIHDAYSRRLGLDSCVAEVLALNPDVIGISCMTPSFTQASRLITALKKENPQVPLLLGGPHITALPAQTMNLVPGLDVGVLREGEVTIVELMDCLTHGKDLKEVKGVIYRRDNQIEQTTDREFIRDLDHLPLPAWDLLPSLTDPYRVSIIGSKGDKSTSLLTSRGCPGRCTFCDVGGVGRKIRGFSADYVLNMIEHLIGQYGINDFLIYDDTFMALKKRTRRICEEIISRGWKIHWSCCARVDIVDPEILALMKKAGCWQIEYGIESGNQDMLDFMKKRIKLEQIERALKWTKSAGIETRGNFIFGFLGETKKTLQDTIDFALKVDLDYFQQTFLTPYPGSEIYGVADSYGYFDKDFNKMTNITINFIPRGMTKEELEKSSAQAFRRFYLRPRIIWHHLKKISNLRDLRRLLLAFWAFLKTLTRRDLSPYKRSV